MTPDAIWELKCVESLRGEHFLQLAVYAWLWTASGSLQRLGPRSFFLLNLLSGEAWQITAGFPALTDIVSALVTARLATKSTASTKEEFLSRCSLLSSPRPDPSLMELNTGALAQLRGMYHRHSAP